MENNIAEDIRLLEWPECVKQRAGLYIGTSAGEEGNNPDVLTREIINNSQDECFSSTCNKIFINLNFNGYQFIADNGRGIRIDLSPDKPLQTMADVAISSLHSGSKFDKSKTGASLTGMNGLGLSVTNALSESFILMSKITQDNFDKSIKSVFDLWNSTKPKNRKNLYYVLVYEDGYKKFEGALDKSDVEKKAFPGKEIPEGYSTLIFFKPSPLIFDNLKSKLPLENLKYFLLIQEKIYKKKVQIIADGVELIGADIPYKYSLIRTITPADTSMNPKVTVLAFWEIDDTLSGRETFGSCNGLVVNQGHHIQIFESCFDQALREEFKISHKYTLNGLKMCVIVLASETIFDSQTKVRLKSIAKVKISDFGELVKDITKVFRQNQDYWQKHVEKLNFLADSMKSLSAVEKAEKLKSGSGLGADMKLRAELQGKFVDAICPPEDRWLTELFIVEGKSAAGSLVSGRKSCKFHAVLPLRGRVLNTDGMSEDKMLDNIEMYTLFKAIGLGLDCNNIISGAPTKDEAYALIKKLARYSKLVISTDADADGSIIASSLLYTISRFARFLIDFGMVYLIESPIFYQAGTYFFPSDPCVPGTDIPAGLNMSKHFKRYKGLGSLNKNEVFEAFFDTTKRRLIQVTPDGIEYSMGLIENIQNRKNLLISKGILSNPYGLSDL